MNWLVTANRPAKSDAERAEQMSREFDTDDSATECAESWLRDGYSAVTLWKLQGRPTLKQVVSWGEPE